MIFSSYAFMLLFLPLTLLGYYVLRANGVRGASLTFLLVASLAFYAVWNVWHLALLGASVCVNYMAGRFIASAADRRHRRRGLWAGIVFNLALIFAFKYSMFAAANLAAIADVHVALPHILLPLGISFFTFQQIAYLVDCWKTGDREKSFRDYALFVSFFPQLIAGPIVHHGYTRPQFGALAKRAVNFDYLPYGVMIFAMGLAKKTLIADPIARGIDPVWTLAADNSAVIGIGAAWSAVIGYALQIYFDFSGYCDMAIGLALLFGVRLPVNFNSPYKSKSIIEFWRRWHMTLSAFLRDYVYIPLGGNRGGELVRLRNIFLTMLIGGVWHGAAWTFIIWGAIHAALITANHAARLWLPGLDRWSGPWAGAAKQAATLSAIVLAWIFFRADGLGAAGTMISALAGGPASGAIDPYLAGLLAFASALVLFAPNSLEVAGYVEALDKPFPRPDSQAENILRPTPLAAAATAILLAAGLAVAWRPAVFIYFNF